MFREFECDVKKRSFTPVYIRARLGAPEWYGATETVTAKILALLPLRESQRLARLSKQMLRISRRALEINLKLSTEQALAFRAALSGKNVFITGGAGVGKSHLLQKIQLYLRPNTYAVTASTGCAAAIIGANTLHATLGIGLASAPAAVYISKIKENRSIYPRLRSLKTLIIDEVGMLDGKTFDKAGAVLAGVRRGFESGATASADNSFDDVQVIACGDFLQLPPVQADKNGWIFDSAAWKVLKFDVHVLALTHRQLDGEFVRVLGRARLGQSTQADIGYLMANSAAEPPEGALQLFAVNRPADEVNQTQLSRLVKELGREAHRFLAVDKGPDAKLKHSPAPKELWLAEGARVMCLRNLVVGQLVNGSLGTVSRIAVRRDAGDKPAGAVVYVKFDGVMGGKPFTYNFQTVDADMPAADVARIYSFTVNDGKHELASRVQLPLRLSWASSIHKAQGTSLDRATIDFGSTFECGQAYTALSRMRAIGGAHLKNLRLSHLLRVAKVPLAFYGRGSADLGSAQVRGSSSS